MGGDDFIAIVSECNYERVCQNIIAEFDSSIMQYFTEEDQERGYLEVINRKGVLEQFPLTSISIGVVVAEKNNFSNILQIGDAATGVKHLAKVTPGSSYAINRRGKNNE